MVQPLEEAEDLLVISGCDSDAIVPDLHHPTGTRRFRRHIDPRGVGPAILDRVAQQVLHQSGQLTFIAQHAGERAHRDFGAALVDGPFQEIAGLFHCAAQIHPLGHPEK